jgi:hypothetical protein
MLVIALAVPNPTEAQWRVFNVVLALVAAAIAAILPGVLHLHFTPWLRAGGALAVFALVFLVKPAGLVAANPFKPLQPPPALELARPVVDAWLALIDAERYDDAYDQSHISFRRQYSEEDFVQLARNVRQPMGTVHSRVPTGQSAVEVPLGDRGHARAYLFMTRFERSDQPVAEQVFVFAHEGAGSWEPAGYFLNVQPASN